MGDVTVALLSISYVPSFMFKDVLGSLIAVLAFASLLYAPGYIVAYAGNLFDFRRLDFAARSLWAIACSFMVMPIVAYFTGRICGLTGICAIMSLAALLAALLILHPRTSAIWHAHDRRISALLVLGWIAFALLMLVEFQVGKKLYFSVVMADQSYRIAFTDAVVRTGVPPANPLYFAGAPVAMRYYYFWYVLCAAVVKYAHVTSQQAFIASTIWAGFGLLATVKLYTTHFFRWSKRQQWIALGLLAVTGADLIPSLGNAIGQPSLNGDIEWWSVDPIDAWPDSLLWVPHHVASVLCCLLAFLFLWRTLEPVSRGTRRLALTIAALACASAFGLSVYVTFGFAILIGAWMLWIAFRKYPERNALWSRIAITTALSLAALAPFLYELLHNMPQTTEAGPPQHLFTLSVRPMIDSGLLTGAPFLAAWNRAHPLLLDQAVRLVLLIPGLAMELGLYGAALILLLRSKRRSEAMRDHAFDTSLFFTIAGLLMSLFLSSSVISNNDFGYRAVMLPQFFLTLLTAQVLSTWWAPSESPVITPTVANRRVLYSLFYLGAAGTLCGAILLRAWHPFVEHQNPQRFGQLSADDFQIREAFDKLHHIAPQNAVVSFRPLDPELDRQNEVMTPNEFYQRMLVLNTGRQILNAEGKCAVHFGGDPSKCRPIQMATAQLYSTPAPSAESARAYCTQFGVQYLTLSQRDPNWAEVSGWPVTLPVVATEPRFRILSCAGREGY
jgi:hypothetical protein